jgi:hypothetical protein
VIQAFAETLRKKIREDMNNYADDCAGGACRSFEEYQKLCGVIQGLALAEAHLIDLAKRVEEAND